MGESALNALVAAHHGVPLALITGDEATAAEAEPFLPGVEAVVVKHSVDRRRPATLMMSSVRAITNE